MSIPDFEIKTEYSEQEWAGYLMNLVENPHQPNGVEELVLIKPNRFRAVMDDDSEFEITISRVR